MTRNYDLFPPGTEVFNTMTGRTDTIRARINGPSVAYYLYGHKHPWPATYLVRMDDADRFPANPARLPAVNA